MELVILIIIALFIIIYRKNDGTLSFYNMLKSQFNIVYQKYAPYSFQTISAKVKAIYSMSPKDIGEYISSVSAVTDYESFYNVLQLFQKSYSWAYTNGLSETRIDSKEATEIFTLNYENCLPLGIYRKSCSLYLKNNQKSR